jgi:hypothetical protein
VQALRDVQETACSEPLTEPLGFGMAWTRQRTPFQASARFTVRRAARSKALPTAVQAVPDGQDTPNKPPLSAPLGRTVRWIRQRVPFHLSARVNVRLDRLAECEPTAVQARPDVHATADSSLMVAPAGFGVRSTFHPLTAAVRAWLACATPVVPIHAQPSNKVRTPSSRTACAQRTLARDPLPARLT